MSIRINFRNEIGGVNIFFIDLFNNHCHQAKTKGKTYPSVWEIKRTFMIYNKTAISHSFPYRFYGAEIHTYYFVLGPIKSNVLHNECKGVVQVIVRYVFILKIHPYIAVTFIKL